MPSVAAFLLLAASTWQLCLAHVKLRAEVVQIAQPMPAIYPPYSYGGPEATSFACDIRAWVRAPDLSPNLVSLADARLLANGSDCVNLTSWSVKLAFKERSIVRLAALDVVLPTRPEHNETEETAYWASREACHDFNNVMDFGGGMPCEQNASMRSPWQVRDEAYRASMMNDSLWELHSAVKVVFESSVKLAENKDGIALKAIQSFALAVPNINLPPTASDEFGNFYNGDPVEYSEAETSFQYSFVFELRNGSTLEVPAGKTGFSPVRTTEPQDVQTTQTLSLTALPSMDTSSGGYLEARKGRDWELQVTLPSSATYIQGQNVELTVKVKRLNQSTEDLPTALHVDLSNFAAKTWAASFGHSDVQRSSLAGEARPLWSFADSSPFGRQLHPTEETDCPPDQTPIAVDMIWRPNQHQNQVNTSRAELHKLDEEEVILSFTVPLDFLPSFQSTFTENKAYLHFRLETRRPENLSLATEDLHDDAAWSSYPRCGTPFDPPLSSFIHVGNFSVTVLPSATQANPAPVSYLAADCPAPLLLPSLPADSSSIQFGKVNPAIRQETPEESKKKRRYSNWRIPYVDDGHTQHAGQLWGRKLKREEKTRREEAASKLVVQARARA